MKKARIDGLYIGGYSQAYCVSSLVTTIRARVYTVPYLTKAVTSAYPPGLYEALANVSRLPETVTSRRSYSRLS